MDVDLNYVGALDRELMLAERRSVDEALQAIAVRRGYGVRRVPGEHAGGKWFLRYPSALGQDANLEVDLNYMFRVPLWPIAEADSRMLGTYGARRIRLLDIDELAAGKLAALFARTTGRDLFDVHQLLTQASLDRERLRLAFVVYGAMNRRDWRTNCCHYCGVTRWQGTPSPMRGERAW